MRCSLGLSNLERWHFLLNNHSECISQTLIVNLSVHLAEFHCSKISNPVRGQRVRSNSLNLANL